MQNISLDLQYKPNNILLKGIITLCAILIWNQ